MRRGLITAQSTNQQFNKSPSSPRRYAGPCLALTRHHADRAIEPFRARLADAVAAAVAVIVGAAVAVFAGVGRAVGRAANAECRERRIVLGLPLGILALVECAGAAADQDHAADDGRAGGDAADRRRCRLHAQQIAVLAVEEVE